MVYKNIYINLTIRIVLLTLTCVGFGLVISLTKDYFTIINVGILIALQSVLIMHFLNRTNKDIALFIDSVKSEDSSILFTRQRKGKLFQKLYESFDEFNLLLQKTKGDLITQNQYFKTVADHVNIGLLSIDQDEKIEFLNKNSKEFFNTEYIKNLQSLQSIDEKLYTFIKELKAGENKTFKFQINNSLQILLFRATQLKTRNKTLKIIAFQDIKPELEEKEIDAWQKLIKVLNHEIMNSISPINSTIDTISDYLNSNVSSENKINKTIEGLDIVKERSEGLKNFVSRYRSMVNIPKPEIRNTSIKVTLESIKGLMETIFREKNITCTITTKPDNLHFDVDRNLIEQVLINILKNAVDSFYKIENIDKKIAITALKNKDGDTNIQISNNGAAIPEEVLENIFIPFYSTKENGSGIGLSLSKQIIKLHGGEIRLIPSKEFTIFEIKFQQL